jgi:MFS-type transporter involved in bile tolerance (Atg22 family)
MLFLANIVMWTICIFFTIQASIVLLTIGLFIYLCLIPIVEASEQTILQKVIAPERQGRVFGFAQSVEQAASPITAFIIGPIAQLILEFCDGKGMMGKYGVKWSYPEVKGESHALTHRSVSQYRC